MVVKKTFRYSNVFSYNHLYQPECFYEKRYIVVVKKTFRYSNVFSTTTYTRRNVFFEKRYIA